MGKMINHYGKWVDPDEPVTGVMSCNTPEHLWEETWNAVDLSFEDWKAECNPTEEEKENYEGDNPTLLIGDWAKVSGLYEPDKNGEYSAIVRCDSNVVQVVWSIYTKRCALCSPCYIGQGDLDSEGKFLAYTLPPEIMGNGG